MHGDTRETQIRLTVQRDILQLQGLFVVNVRVDHRGRVALLHVQKGAKACAAALPLPPGALHLHILSRF